MTSHPTKFPPTQSVGLSYAAVLRGNPGHKQSGPSSVPDRPVTDVDPHTRVYAADGLQVEADLRQRCPVSWSDNYGGFWVVASHQGVTTALRDRGRCSSAKVRTPDGTMRGGQTIPAPPTPVLIPAETDPPEWGRYRKALNPVFSPSAMNRQQARVGQFIDAVINQVIESSEVDFVLDLASPVTALFTLELLGMPLAGWQYYASRVHNFSHDKNSERTRPEIEELFGRLGATVRDQRERGGTGLIRQLIDSDADGQPLTDHEIQVMVFQTILGGFDTTASLLAHAIAGDDKFLRLATEEFIRWSSPVIGLGRTAAEDFDVEDQTIRKGDLLWVLFR